MKRFLLSILAVFFYLGSALYAQQDIQISQFFNHPLFYNPATSGTHQALNVSALYRSQWVNLPGHPVSQLIGVDMPLYQINSGAGIYFSNDKIGSSNNIRVKLTYAYHRKLAGGLLFAGINAGILQSKLNGDELRAPDGEYDPDPGTINHNDPFIPLTSVGAVAPDMGLGLYFTRDNWNVGIAANHLLNPRLTLDFQGGSTEIEYRRHAVFHGLYSFQIGDNIDIQPAILLKSDLVKHQIDFNATLLYNDNFWFGVSYRGYNKWSNDALIGMAGIKLSGNWMLGYSYDYNISSLNQTNSGSHEIAVNYKLSIEKPRKGKIINNPRFLSF